LNVEELKQQVAHWQQEALQLEKLGMEATQQLYADLENEQRARQEIASLLEEETKKREKAEEEIVIANQRYEQINTVMEKLMKIKKDKEK